MSSVYIKCPECGEPTNCAGVIRNGMCNDCREEMIMDENVRAIEKSAADHETIDAYKAYRIAVDKQL